MSDSFVDLLLVRLGKKEEKKKVLKLLITSLDLSVSEAENAVNNSPSVIREAVPMNEARVIQKDLYPYIDLLPRLEDGAADDVVIEDSAGTVVGTVKTGEDTEQKENEVPQEADEEPETGTAEEPEEDESVVITTAAEEIRSTERCHICGRIPTDGERLAPCRTCGKLTCRNCFDRVAHVCNHCAEDGKSVDRPNKSVAPETEKGLEFDSEEPVEKNASPGSVILKMVVAVVSLIALALAFYFIDPLNLFSPESHVVAVDSDSAGVDSAVVAVVDSVETASDDTSVAVEDTVDVEDSTEVPNDVQIDDDPFDLRYLSIPDSLIADEIPPSIDYRVTVPRDVDAGIPGESSEIVFSQIALLAPSIPVVVDDGAFLVYSDTSAVLVLAIRHPEETEVRIRLMREIATHLIPTGVDQLVLIYRENRFQNAVLYSLVREKFPDVAGVLNPRQFQGILGYREDSWESISGPVTQWLSSME